MTAGKRIMSKTRWLDTVGWIAGGLLMGAVVGVVVVLVSRGALLTDSGLLRGGFVGAILGSLGSFVVVSTKATFSGVGLRAMHGVVFSAPDSTDGWYYQDVHGGTHGPFNPSMMHALVEAGAILVENTYTGARDAVPSQSHTRVTLENVVDLRELGFNEATSMIARLG
jgi:hypothetical protein